MHAGGKPRPRAPLLLSGRRIAGRQVERVVVAYVRGGAIRGTYVPQTATLTIYRGRDAQNRILLLI